jgi:hypothetical protein
LLPPKRVFCDEQGNPLRLNAGIAGKSGRRKLVVDWDGDGKLDLLVIANVTSASSLQRQRQDRAAAGWRRWPRNNG